jgi:prepilin-type N-terminal cleavage/methylation domain-containing protein
MCTNRVDVSMMFCLHQRAFTTTELVIVMMLIGILAAFATPHLGRWLAIVRVNSAARHIASELQLSKMRAISQNTRYRISFDPASDTYQVQKQAGTSVWQNINNPISLPTGVDLVSASTNPVFQTLGTSPGGTTITLRNAQGRAKTIKVSFSGRVKIECYAQCNGCLPCN